MNFTIHGPFELPRLSNRLVDTATASKKNFWAAVRERAQGLPEARGCYVFVIKARNGSLPWYVGLTTKRTFKGEVLGAHQVNHYNHALSQKIGVKPQLFLLAKSTPTGRPPKPSKNVQRDIESLETFLVGIALNRNPKLRNSTGTKFLKRVVVPGVINSPRRPPTKPERAMKAALGL